MNYDCRVLCYFYWLLNVKCFLFCWNRNCLVCVCELWYMFCLKLSGEHFFRPAGLRPQRLKKNGVQCMENTEKSCNGTPVEMCICPTVFLGILDVYCYTVRSLLLRMARSHAFTIAYWLRQMNGGQTTSSYCMRAHRGLESSIKQTLTYILYYVCLPAHIHTIL